MKGLFHIGQVVICINDDFRWARKHYTEVHNYPSYGNRYRVRAYACGGRKPALLLREMTNPCVIYLDGIFREAGFWEGRFVAAPLPDSIKRCLVVKKVKAKEKVGLVGPNIQTSEFYDNTMSLFCGRREKR